MENMQSIAIGTEPTNLEAGVEEAFETPREFGALENYEPAKPKMHRKKSTEELVYEEKIKRENDYFMGSKAFEVMKNMSKGDIKRFLELTKNDEDPEYPYIKEYRRFLRKCYEEKKEGVKYPSSGGNQNLQEHYNLTIDLWNLKESEWWF